MAGEGLLLVAVLTGQLTLWEEGVSVAVQVALEETTLDGQDDEEGDGEGCGQASRQVGPGMGPSSPFRRLCQSWAWRQAGFRKRL